MIHSKASWRESPKLRKVYIICTRLISAVSSGAGRKCEIQRGSERIICPGKWPSRTARGGVYPALFTIPAHAPPGQSGNSCLLIKFNGNYNSNTHSGSHKSSHHSSCKKRMRPRKAASSYQLLGSVLVQFQQDLE